MPRITQIPISFVMPAGSPLCCCGTPESGYTCETLPDELQLELSYCGRNWTETLTRRPGVSDAWQTTCYLDFITDCPENNQTRCFVLYCAGGNVATAVFSMWIAVGCGPFGLALEGNCADDSGGVEANFIAKSVDPFELDFESPNSYQNSCNDDPPCIEPLGIRVKIP